MATKKQAGRKSKRVATSSRARTKSKSSSQATFAESYFQELAQSLATRDRDEGTVLIHKVATSRGLRISVQADVALLGQSAALSGLGPLKQLVDRFTTSAGKTRAEIDKLYKLYGRARQVLEENLDIVKVVLDEGGLANGRDLKSLILQYLVVGSCPTRLGEEIKLPGEDSQDKTLDTLLGILRIISEHTWDAQYPDDLPWLAEDTSDGAKRFIKYESKAGELGDKMGGSMGRAAAVGATSLINPVLKLPDEVSVAMAFVAGVQGRKLAEMNMHRYLVKNPEFE